MHVEPEEGWDEDDEAVIRTLITFRATLRHLRGNGSNPVGMSDRLTE